MKYIITILLISTIVLLGTESCKQRKGKATQTDSLINTATSVGPSAIAPSEYKQGAALITKNDCLTCHNLDNKTIGPSYKEVAAKYQFNEGNVDNLAHSIIHGSRGKFGDVPMPAHPTLEINEAKEMVRYILTVDSLKK